MVNELKKCTKCLNTFPLDKFAYISKLSKDTDGKKRRQCKDCDHKSYLKHKDKQLKKSKLRYEMNKSRKSIKVPEQKLCTSCKKILPNKQFYNTKCNNDGLSHYCKICVGINKKKQVYGITYEDFVILYEKQNKKCALCERVLILGDRKTCTDHCHKTGKIRGILCHYCNAGLGHFYDDMDLLIKAIAYLKKNL
jgi:hypothetical protein